MRFLLSIAIAVLPIVTFWQTPFSLQDRAFITSTSPLRKDLAGYWRLEESSGTRYDFSKNGNHMTANASPTRTGGRVGWGLKLTSASSQYLSLASNSSVEVGDNDFTVSASFYMVNLPGSGNFYPIFTKWNGTGNNRQLALVYDNASFSASNDVCFAWSNDGTYSINNTIVSGLGPLKSNTWYQVTAWHDSVNNQTGIRLGTNAAVTKSYSSGVATKGTEVQIGRANSAAYFNGWIDEVGFWRRVLPPAEIVQKNGAGGYGTSFPMFGPTVSIGALGLAWSTGDLILSGGRLDAIEHVGSGVMLAGSRSPTAGHIYRSTDYGDSWTDLGQVVGNNDVTTIKHAGAGVVYATVGNGRVWKSTDSGENWSDLGVVSSATPVAGAQIIYGIWTTATAVMVCDTASSGGHIFRSTNGGSSWSDLGAFSGGALYRFQEVGDGIIVIGWAGKVFKSTDDGATWSETATVSAVPLWAVEYLGSSVVLVADDNGVIYRSSNNGATWSSVWSTSQPTDDLVYLGGGFVALSTTGRDNWWSQDYGSTWTNAGFVRAFGDNIEHMIFINDGTRTMGAGVTKDGYFVTAP